jgi:hypothetical protein
MSLQLRDFCDKFIFLLTHTLELLLHDGVLVDNRMLRLKLIIIALIVLFFFLVNFDTCQ